MKCTPLTRRLAAVIICVVIAVVVGVAAAWRSSCPLGLRVVSVEPSGITSDRGAEFSLVVLEVKNRLHGLVAVGAAKPRKGWLTIEARVAGTWVDTDSHCSLGTFWLNQSERMQLLVPQSADACRVLLAYRTETFKSRLLNRFSSQINRLPPKLIKRIWTAVADRLGPPRRVTLLVSLPTPRAGPAGSTASIRR